MNDDDDGSTFHFVYINTVSVVTISEFALYLHSTLFILIHRI